MKSSSIMVNKTTAGLKKTAESNMSSNISVFQEVGVLMDNIYNMRFIEKVSSPIGKQEKEVLVEKFAGKLEKLHSKL